MTECPLNSRYTYFSPRVNILYLSVYGFKKS